MAPVVDEQERRDEREALDRLAERLGRGERAVAGLPDVRTALGERRVELLLVDDSFEAPDDVFEATVGQSAGVRVVRRHDDLKRLGMIAALLRF
jgi:stalled ribosome rescue protein Dom34